MRIITISLNAWNDTMATGNTFSNFFKDIEEGDILANLYCRNESIDNKICTKYFRVTEKDILKNLFSKNKCGTSFDCHNQEKTVTGSSTKSSKSKKWIWRLMQRLRPSSLLFFREYLWSLNVWKNTRIDSFLHDFNPDVIYMHGHNNLYMHKILWYCHEITNAKVIVFFGDDMYNSKDEKGLKNTYHKMLQKQLKYTINKADLLFGGSPLLCNEYSSLFGKKFNLLIKTCIGLQEPKYKERVFPLTLVYAGNLLYGRDSAIEDIVDVIKEINKNGVKYKLEIFTSTLVAPSMEVKLNDGINSTIIGSKKFDEICKVLDECDFCLFIESFNKACKMITRLSFSTKIIDYMQSSSAILSYGPHDVSSINYIDNSKIGFATNDKENLYNTLLSISKNLGCINNSISDKYQFALKNHSKSRFLMQIKQLVN